MTLYCTAANVQYQVIKIMTARNERDVFREMYQAKFQNNKPLLELMKASRTPMESADGDTSLNMNRALFIEHIVSIDGLALQIGNSQADCFEVKAGKLMPVNKIGVQIRRILSQETEQFDEYFESFQVSPNVVVFMEEFTKIEARALICSCFQIEAQEEVRELIWATSTIQITCDKLNGAVSAIREKINTPEFRKQISKFRRSSDKNLRSFRLYTEKCFEICSRLLVLRVDLYYKNGTFAGKSHFESFEMVQQHWRTWIRRFKRKMGKDYVGYAKILECGIQKSLHFHVLLLLDGSLVRQDIAIATLAGKDWSDVVTQGAGRSHNCNLHKENYRRLGIGMVHADDKDKRAALDKIMAYMIKIDYFIKLVTPDGSRVFSKGDMPRAKLKSGRPRRTSVT